jgi:hypothetical protein
MRPVPRPLAYPESRFAPPPVADFGVRTERERLSAPALKAFFNIVGKWGVRDEDARALLGGVSNGVYYEWKKSPADRVLESDQLTRISLLIGIYKALHILHGERLADDWVKLPNRNRIFGGQTPVAYMVAGGIAGIQTVRRLLDARRGGA